MSDNTPIMRVVLQCLLDHVYANLYQPTYRELAAELDTNPIQVVRTLRKLEVAGYVELSTRGGKADSRCRAIAITQAGRSLYRQLKALESAANIARVTE